MVGAQGLRVARDAVRGALADRQIMEPFDGAFLSREAGDGDVGNSGQVLAETFMQTELEADIAIRRDDAASICKLIWGGVPSTVTSLFDRVSGLARVESPCADLPGQA